MTVVKNSRIKISNRPSEPTLDLTLVAPVYNEEDSIELLVQGVSSVLDELKISYEFICIDDGSHDNSASKIKELIKIHNNLKLITFRKNYGQTAAIMAGIDHSLGRVIICIDADLQNDPADIPKLLEKLSEGYDVVSGWRKNRKDAKIKRVFLSNLANRIISYVSGVNLKDYGCTLKAYRREVVHGSRLYGEMHRFIPIYASWNGAKITEIPVAHHARRFGYSKYGIGRVVKVILDLFVIIFMQRYINKPIYFFGGFSIACFFAAFSAFIYMIYLKFFSGVSLILTPLPLVSSMFFLTGMMSLLLGILAEMMTRIYYESQDRTAYIVREIVDMSYDRRGSL